MDWYEEEEEKRRMEHEGHKLISSIITNTVADTLCPKCGSKTLVSNPDEHFEEYYISCINNKCWFWSTWENFKTTLKT